MKSLLAAVLILACTTPCALATAQYADKILYDGKEYSLHTNPMEPYFAKHPELRPHSGSTALWRGYVATFLITSAGDGQIIPKFRVGWTIRLSPRAGAPKAGRAARDKRRGKVDGAAFQATKPRLVVDQHGIEQ